MPAQWYGILKRNAECACRYGDNGIWATVMYQITGDAKYVNLAWARFTAGFLKSTGRALVGNYAREYSQEMVLIYDWLYPGSPPLSARRSCRNSTRCSRCWQQETSTPARSPIRTADTDQTVGSYFGFAFLALATGDHNPAGAGAVLEQLHRRPRCHRLRTEPRSVTPSSSTSASSRRAANGWRDRNTTSGPCACSRSEPKASRQRQESTTFPRSPPSSSDAALRQVYMMTPDLKGSVQWGDEQNPRQVASRLFSWQTTNGILAGLTQGDTQERTVHSAARVRHHRTVRH